MYKKIILILLSFLLVGCGTNINKMSLEEIIDDAIVGNNSYINVNVPKGTSSGEVIKIEGKGCDVCL